MLCSREELRRRHELSGFEDRSEVQRTASVIRERAELEEAGKHVKVCCVMRLKKLPQQSREIES